MEFIYLGFDAKLIGSFKYASNDINDIPTCSVWINNQNQGICSGFVDFKGLVLFDYAQKEKIKSVFSFESEAKDARANKSNYMKYNI